VVWLLLQDGRADPAGHYNDAIHYASVNGHVKVVQLLLQDKRVDPAAPHNYAIRRASENGHAGVVWLLLQNPRIQRNFGENEARGLLGRLDQDNPVRGVLDEYLNRFRRDAGDGGREPTPKRLKDPAFYY
jgi:hypothetical protein